MKIAAKWDRKILADLLTIACGNPLRVQETLEMAKWQSSRKSVPAAESVRVSLSDVENVIKPK